MNQEIFNKAMQVMKEAYGENAGFFEGQYEAIEATLSNKRTLVVQKTGWGKSLVYFVASKILGGVTLIISPLLVLMDNQMEYAEKFHLKCGVINSSVKDEARTEFFEKLKNQEYDVVFTTPETLQKEEVQSMLPQLPIRLLVIDECHCISDWGHDFRLQYSKLNRVIAQMPENVAVLGTTATANDRVIEDLKKQFGDNVFVSRGPLSRDSLHIEILKMNSQVERYAWMKENIPKLPGTGIVYCLTRRDCDLITDYLMENGISARRYYSNSENEETLRETERLFSANKIKVIVATVKLGMGYDKSDIGFVIHYQKPSSVVAYYQQIGRAGRKEGIEAYCYMMTGEEDDKISTYFIEHAFPTEEEERKIIDALEQTAEGLSVNDMMRLCDIRRTDMERVLNMLMNQDVIYKDGSKYKRSMNPYHYNGEHYDNIKKMKYAELDTMKQYIHTKECLSKFIVNCLNDDTAKPCGKCANCLQKEIFDPVVKPTAEDIAQVEQLIGARYLEIEPKKRWPVAENGLDRNTVISALNETGLALSKYGQAGYGEMVAHDKYHEAEFRDELVQKSIAVLKEKLADQGYTAVTNIPSARNKKVENFARKLAEGLGMEYLDTLEKTDPDAPQQKTLNNSFYQFNNVKNSMQIKDGVTVPENVILVDDMVDSGWTLTVGGWYLLKHGAQKVFPFCLADSSMTGDD